MPGIFVEIVGNASQFKRELDGAVRSTAKANSGFHKMGRAAGVAGLALGGALAVGLVHAAKGALQDEAANDRLATSFKNAHQPIGAFKDQIQKATDAAVKMGFKDEEAAGSLGTLVTATGDGKKAIDLLGSAMDIARFKHINLEAASKILTGTMSGNVRSAKQLGIILLPVTSHVDALRAKYKELGEEIPKAELRTAKFQDKQATAADAIQKVNDKLHGQAAAFSETGEGKAAVFSAQMDQLSDNLGKTLLPALNYVLDALNSFAGVLKKHPDLVIALTIALGGLAAALLLVSAATIIVEAAMSPILVPLAAVVIAIGVLSYVTYKLVTDFRKNWALLLPIVLGPLGAIILAVKTWHTQIFAAFSAAWNAITGAARAGASAIEGAVRSMVGVVTGLFGNLRGAWEGLRAAAGKTIHFLFEMSPLRVAKSLIDAIISAWHLLESAARSVINFKIHVPHISLPHIPGFATGGVVPGAIGAPMLAMVHGGETVIPAGAGLRGSGGVAEIHTHVYLDGKQISETVRRELLRTQGRTGSLGFT